MIHFSAQTQKHWVDRRAPTVSCLSWSPLCWDITPHLWGPQRVSGALRGSAGPSEGQRGPQRVSGAPRAWHRAQNLKRSMKCCGETGSRAWPGATAGHGWPQSWNTPTQRHAANTHWGPQEEPGAPGASWGPARHWAAPPPQGAHWEMMENRRNGTDPQLPIL